MAVEKKSRTRRADTTEFERGDEESEARVSDDFEQQPNEPDTDDGLEGGIGETENVPYTQGLGPHVPHAGVAVSNPSEIPVPYMHPEEQNMDMTPQTVGPPAYTSPDPATAAGRLVPVTMHPLRDVIDEDYGKYLEGVTATPTEGTHPGAPGQADLGEGGTGPLTSDIGGGQGEGGESGNYSEQPVAELRELAAQRDIPGRSDMNKEELVAALEAYDETNQGS